MSKTKVLITGRTVLTTGTVIEWFEIIQAIQRAMRFLIRMVSLIFSI